jgi:hypothetical protein
VAVVPPDDGSPVTRVRVDTATGATSTSYASVTVAPAATSVGFQRTSPLPPIEGSEVIEPWLTVAPPA